MSLENYGVAIGTAQSCRRDDPDEYGKHYHGHIELQTADGIYDCTIDVDTPNANISVEHRIVSLKAVDLRKILLLPDGFTDLVNNSSSGALDYIRNKALQPSLGCLPSILKPLTRLTMSAINNFSWGWVSASGEETLDILDTLLANARQVFIFGEPFESGLGLHNIHQNQGDPVDSLWGPANGIWQDGAVIVRTNAGKISALLIKFSSQSYETDNYGDPIT